MERVPLRRGGFLDALARADGEVDVRLGRWRKSEVREYVEAILMAVAVAFALRAFVIEAFKIPSGSMIPTLMVGDHIFVNKFSYGPAIPYTHVARLDAHAAAPRRRHGVRLPRAPGARLHQARHRPPGGQARGQERPPHPQRLGGAELPRRRVDVQRLRLAHRAARGDLYVEYLGDESYLTFYDRASGAFPEYQGPFFAKPGEVWVMGDNRNNSHDSRMWFGGQGGGVPFENIRGRALFVWLSVSDNGIDWSREFAPVMGRPRLPPAARRRSSRSSSSA